MPHEFPVPDTERLEALLEQAFVAMQEAETARLNRLEERLVRRLEAVETQKSPNRIPWWIVLVLGGGVAMAGWYVAERIVPDNTGDAGSMQALQPPEERTESPDNQSGIPEKSTENRNRETIKRERSPVIYQRGNY